MGGLHQPRGQPIDVEQVDHHLGQPLDLGADTVRQVGGLLLGQLVMVAAQRLGQPGDHGQGGPQLV